MVVGSCALSSDELLELASEDELSGVVVEVPVDAFVEEEFSAEEDDDSAEEFDEELALFVELDESEDDALELLDDEWSPSNRSRGSLALPLDDSDVVSGTKIDCGLAPMPWPWLET